MRSVSDSKATAKDKGAKVICPTCKRPMATGRDILMWLNSMGRHGEVCLDGVDYPRITPEEEAIPDASLLKERLIGVRKQRDWLACLAVAGRVTK